MWTYWPPFSIPSPTSAPSLSSNIQLWLMLNELWKAARQRNVATASPSSGPRHPRHDFVFDRGVITAVDADTNAITIDGKTWDTTGTYNDPWTSVNLSPPPSGSFDIVIDDCDPRKVVHCRIASILNEDTVITSNILDEFATQRIVPSVASLVGKTAFILESGGLWWSERIPQWPNDTVYAIGHVASATDQQIVASTSGWTVNQWVGYQVVYRDGVTNLVDRGTIISNTANTLHFVSELTQVASGDFVIVAANALYEFDRVPDPAYSWYSGPTELFKSHYPYDADQTRGAGDPTLGDQTIANTPKAVLLLDDPDATPSQVTVFDVDYWTAAITYLSEPYCPAIWKSLRQLQVFLEDCGERGKFIDPTKNYDGVSTRPEWFRAATLLLAAGINSQISRTGQPITSGTLSGSIRCPLIMPSGFGSDTPMPVIYAILDDKENVLASGTANWQNGVLIGSDFANTTPTVPPVFLYAYKKIVVSLGWSRWVPREFKYYYGKTCFIPDYDPTANGGLGGYVDPPTSAFPGTWLARPRSNHYIEHSGLGFVQESTFARDLIDPPNLSGDYTFARYVGDNWNDPAIYSGQFFDGSADPVVVQQYNRFFCGKHASSIQAVIDGQRSGNISSFSQRSITDSSKDWWGTNWYKGGILHTETGTATAGNTTSLTDSTKVANGFWTTASRGRWVGFIVEVTIAAVVYRRPILSHAGNTITWEEPLPATANGKTYQIREPKYELNRWKERTVTITWPDLSVRTFPILNSDDTTLYFLELDKPIINGCSYIINEAQPGTVWMRYRGLWRVPQGVDPRSSRVGDGHAVSFLPDQSRNSPTFVKRYGRMMMGDYITLPMLMEFYTVFNWLQYTIGEFGWVTRHDPVVPETNHRQNFRNPGGADFANAEADFSLDYVYNLFGPPPDNVPPGNPIEGTYSNLTAWGAFDIGLVPICAFATRSNSLNWGNTNNSVVVRVYGYGSAVIGNGDNCTVNSTTDFYALAVAPFTDLSPTPINSSVVLTGNRCNAQIKFYDDTGGQSTEQIWLFDANGDTVQCSVYKLFSSTNANYFDGFGLWDRRSGRLGSNGSTAPTRPLAITNDGPLAVISGDSSRGWEVVDQFQITRWTFDQAVPINQLAAAAKPQPAIDMDFWLLW